MNITIHISWWMLPIAIVSTWVLYGIYVCIQDRERDSIQPVLAMGGIMIVMMLATRFLP